TCALPIYRQLTLSGEELSGRGRSRSRTDVPNGRFHRVDLVVVFAAGIVLGLETVVELASGPLRSAGMSPLLADAIGWGVANGLILVIALGITRLRYGRVASPLRLHRPTLRTTLVGLVGAVGLAAINFAVMFLPLDGGPAGGIADGPAWAQLVFAVLFGVVVTGFYEEVVYRGVLMTGLSDRFGSKAGLVLSSLAFGLAHLPRAYNTVTGLLAGRYLGWLHRRYDSLSVVIIAHGLGNALLGVAAAGANVSP